MSRFANRHAEQTNSEARACDFPCGRYSSRMKTRTSETCGGSGTLCDLTVSPPEDVPCEDCGGRGKGKYEKLTKGIFQS